MEVTGMNQGKIDGSCEMEGRENTMLVYSYDHKVQIPRNPTDGLPSGKRVHMPLKIVKVTDKGSPKLYQALCTGEHLENVTLKQYRIDPTGNEEHYYTIVLENAIVVEMNSYMPMSFMPANEPYLHMEELLFSYEKIKWTWEVDGIESEDSWKKPV
jgi:type VI secretion system secreted protein Hcp